MPDPVQDLPEKQDLLRRYIAAFRSALHTPGITPQERAAANREITLLSSIREDLQRSATAPRAAA